MASLIQIGGIMKEIQGIKSDFEVWYTNKTQEVQKAMDEVQKIQRGERGFVGPKGDKGDSIVGPMGPRGERGEKGDVGDMPVAGLDFPLPKDGIDGKDGKDADPDAVIARLKALPVGKRLKVEHIDGLQPTLDAFSRQVSEHKFGSQMRGGGDTVIAGTGITITRSASTGKSTISSSVTSVGYQVPTGTVNGVNTTFVFASAPNVVIVDGVTLRATASDGTTNWTGTTTVVLTVAPTFECFGVA